MAIDFTMTEKGLFTDTTTQPTISTTVPEVSSSYLEVVNIPAYDSANPSHLLITEANGKWTSANLNSSSYKHFYVESGNYSGSTITLTADGSVNDRRSISLHNGNEIHPASLSEALQANIRIKFDGASYWDIDRMSNIDQTTQTDVTWFQGGSTYNVINRFHLENFYSGITIGASLSTPNNYNTIQNTYLNGMTEEGRDSDNVGMALYNGSLSGLRTVGTKIINNDIKNCNDGIQLIRSFSKPSDVGFNGTIVDSNRVWVDNTIYYDKSLANGGILDPNGLYAKAENAMDIKAGSADSNDPVIVTNNIFWGFRQEYEGGGAGGTMGIMYGVKNVKIENNIMFDATRGLSFNDQGDETYAADSVLVKNNIFHLMNKADRSYVNLAYESDNITWESNSFIGMPGGYGILFQESSAPAGTADYIYNNNLSIDAGKMSILSGNMTASNNYYYNTVNNINGTGDITETKSSNMADYSFQYEIFTTSPKSKTLTGVITTESSPHYGIAGSSITEGAPGSY